MRLNRTPLHVISINEPCHENWDDMTPVARARFCAHCQRPVHDLSRMTSAEVDDLLCRTAGPLCARYSATSDGRVVTLDYEPANRTPPRWLRWALPAALVSIAAAALQWPGAMTTRTMGSMRCYPRSTTAPTSTTQPITGELSAVPDESADDSANE